MKSDIKFLVLTNNSEQTPLNLKLKLEGRRITNLSEGNFITSAMATARSLKTQKSDARDYLIGGGGLISELDNVGFSISGSNPDYVVMTIATRKLAVHVDDTVMIGDRMDTDIVGGMEAGMTTCLVLSGVSKLTDLSKFPCKPEQIFKSVGEIDFRKTVGD